MERNLLFILTLYNPKEEELDYWKTTRDAINNMGFDFYVLLDNPSIESKIKDKLGEENLFVNKENLGKFETIYNFIQNNNFKETHFKVLDPDDKINLESLKDFYVKLEGIILLKHRYMSDEGEIIKEMNSLGTSWTILPIKEIKEDKLYLESEFKIRNWIEDQILGIIAYLNGAKIERSIFSFYEYNIYSGMTNEIDEDDYNEIINALDFVKELFDKTGKMPAINFPGGLWYIKRLISESKHFDENTKEKYIEELEKYTFKLNVII